MPLVWLPNVCPSFLIRQEESAIATFGLRMAKPKERERLPGSKPEQLKVKICVQVGSLPVSDSDETGATFPYDKALDGLKEKVSKIKALIYFRECPVDLREFAFI